MDASDPKQVRIAQKSAKIADRQRQSVITNLMSTIEGRRFIYDTLESCHVFVSSFALNALQMGFNEGERNVGLRLLNDIMRVCPDHYVLMAREYNERSTSNGNRTDSANAERSSGEGTEWGTENKRDPNDADPHGYYQA